MVRLWCWAEQPDTHDPRKDHLVRPAQVLDHQADLAARCKDSRFMGETSVDGDRTVFGFTVTGAEIVRYGRVGRWYIEPALGSRWLVSVADAATAARWGTARLGLPAGRRFDALVRAGRAGVAS